MVIAAPLLLSGCGGLGEMAVGTAIGFLGHDEAKEVFVVSKEAECLAYSGIYLDEPDIAALSRPGKEKIATHNLTFEARCPEQ